MSLGMGKRREGYCDFSLFLITYVHTYMFCCYDSNYHRAITTDPKQCQQAVRTVTAIVCMSMCIRVLENRDAKLPSGLWSKSVHDVRNMAVEPYRRLYVVPSYSSYLYRIQMYMVFSVFRRVACTDCYRKEQTLFVIATFSVRIPNAYIYIYAYIRTYMHT